MTKKQAQDWAEATLIIGGPDLYSFTKMGQGIVDNLLDEIDRLEAMIEGGVDVWLAGDTDGEDVWLYPEEPKWGEYCGKMMWLAGSDLAFDPGKFPEISPGEVRPAKIILLPKEDGK